MTDEEAEADAIKQRTSSPKVDIWQEAEPGLGAPSLGLEFFLGSFTSPFGFPPKMFKPSLSHLRLKDAIGYEGPDVSERRLPEATGDASQ